MFADIVIDIVHEAVDRIFEYKVPVHLELSAAIGKTVVIPFGAGNRSRTGYIVGIKEIPDYNRHMHCSSYSDNNNHSNYSRKWKK